MWEPKGWRAVLGIGAIGLLLGCSMEPNATLLSGPATPNPIPVARVGPATTPSGYPNVLVNPVFVPGVPKPPAAVARIEQRLAAERGRTEAAAAVPSPSHVADLERLAATHAEQARRVIEASGKKPATDTHTGASPGV